MKRSLFAGILAFFCLSVAAQVQPETHKQNSEQSFEEMVKMLERPNRGSWQKPEEVMALLGSLKGKKVMDIGCGTGYFTFRMIDSGATVIAADIDERFLAYVDSVRNARGISIKKVQTRKLPPDNPMLEKREADMVIMVNTFHHIEDRVNYLKKVRTGLRQTGYIVIIDYLKKELPIGPSPDKKLSADDVVRDLKMAGFSQFKTDDKTLPYQYIVFAM